MSDYGRYGDDTRHREHRDNDRHENRGFSRNSDSIFSGFGDNNRNERREGRSENIGGWGGLGGEKMGDRSSGRNSAYGQDQHDNRSSSSRWTDERENMSWGRDKDHGRDRNRDRHRETNRGGIGGRDDEHYGRDDYREGLPLDETSRLIASNKVEGTSVYGSDGERLGSIYNFMVNKFSGEVEYAVMSYGGFLGMGQRYYPLPWRVLNYDTRQGGYRVNMRERDLRDAPSFDRDSEPEFNQDYGRRVHGWYGLNH